MANLKKKKKKKRLLGAHGKARRTVKMGSYPRFYH